MIYNSCIAQLFLHSALHGKEFCDYPFQDLLLSKLEELDVDFVDELRRYNQTITKGVSSFTLIRDLVEPIPFYKKFGVYCHCIQLGINTILREGNGNEWFNLLPVAFKVSIDELNIVQQVFTDMRATFIKPVQAAVKL
jgi:hypothetical protein